MIKYKTCDKHEEPVTYNPEETKDGKCPKCDYNDRLKYDTRTIKSQGTVHF